MLGVDAQSVGSFTDSGTPRQGVEDIDSGAESVGGEADRDGARAAVGSNSADGSETGGSKDAGGHVNAWLQQVTDRAAAAPASTSVVCNYIAGV